LLLPPRATLFPYTTLFRSIHHSLEVVCKEPSIIRFIFMSVRIDSNYRNTRLYQLVAEFTSHTTRVVEEGIKAGLFRDSYHTSLIDRKSTRLNSSHVKISYA